METGDFYVLVEGPAWGDAQFYGEWLLAAAKAQVLLKNALQDQQFATQSESLRVVYEPDFGIAATVMLMNLRGHWTTFVLNLESEQGEEFAMMAGMGFFVQCGHTWQMTIPPLLTLDTLKELHPHVRKNRRSRVCPSSRTTHRLYVLGGGNGVAEAARIISRFTR